MLKITNLSVALGEETVVEDINLEVNEGEIHAILGPTSAGKSVLANIILGHPQLEISKGRISFKRKVLTKYSPEDRSRMGIFLTFQDPPEIEAITNLHLVRDLLKYRNEKNELTTVINRHTELVKNLELGSEWGNKEFNLAASHAEKKKNELVQMNMLDPSLVIIDDIGFGLEEKTNNELGTNISEFLKQKGKAGIIITQDARILNSIKPTHVHVMVNGKIVKSGDRRIIKRIINNGYREFS